MIFAIAAGFSMPRVMPVRASRCNFASAPVASASRSLAKNHFQQARFGDRVDRADDAQVLGLRRNATRAATAMAMAALARGRYRPAFVQNSA